MCEEIRERWVSVAVMSMFAVMIAASIIVVMFPYDDTPPNIAANVSASNETSMEDILDELLEEVKNLREEIAMARNSTLEPTAGPISLFDPRVSTERSPVTNILASSRAAPSVAPTIADEAATISSPTPPS